MTHRLTPDVLPYRGHGIASKSEYAKQMALLRRVADSAMMGEQGLAVLNASEMDSDTTDAFIAISRGGLVRRRSDGFYKLTDYGRLYLHQREPRYIPEHASRDTRTRGSR
jgi:hypothetical protein